MKRIISLLMTLVLIFGALTTLSSCGKPKDDGAEINIYLGSQVFDFDPSDYYVSANAERVLALIYEPLFTLKNNGKVKCAAAEDYEVDKEERKITITLRESYWSDNIKVTSNDFVYAWCERIINPANPNPAAALFLDVEGVKEAMNGASISDVGISAPSSDVITIKYVEGADYNKILKNLASVATAPVRQDLVSAAPTTWSKSSVVTNGAFKVKSYDKQEGTFELARNLGYHQDYKTKDYDNKVRPGMLYGNFTFAGNDISVSYKDIKDKVVFIMADATLADRAKYKRKADVADDTSVYTYVFNTQHPLFADVNVRLALSAAIDREAIVEAITFGKAADGFIPDVSGGAKKDIISTTADLAKAREYLAKADQNVVNANKNITLTIDSDEQSKAIAELVKAAWGELGFTVTVDALSPVTTKFADGSTALDSGIQYLVKSVAMGTATYDVLAIDWQTYSVDALAGLASLTSNLHGLGREYISGTPGADGVADSSKARSNLAFWQDAEYDKLVLDAGNATKKKDRKNLLIDAEKYLMEKMPVCPLVFNQSFVFTGSKVSNVELDALGNLNLVDTKLARYRKYFKVEETEE